MATSAQTAVYECLVQRESLAEYLSSGQLFRCYPDEAPQGAAKPYLIIRLLGLNPANSHGQGSGESHMDQAYIELIAVAESSLVTFNILHEARLAIEAHPRLKGVQLGARSLPREEEADAFARSADFNVWNDPDA